MNNNEVKKYLCDYIMSGANVVAYNIDRETEFGESEGYLTQELTGNEKITIYLGSEFGISEDTTVTHYTQVEQDDDEQ